MARVQTADVIQDFFVVRISNGVLQGAACSSTIGCSSQPHDNGPVVQHDGVADDDTLLCDRVNVNDGILGDWPVDPELASDDGNFVRQQWRWLKGGEDGSEHKTPRAAVIAKIGHGRPAD